MKNKKQKQQQVKVVFDMQHECYYLYEFKGNKWVIKAIQK